MYCKLFWKDESGEKEAGNGPILKKKDTEYLGHFYLKICCQSLSKVAQSGRTVRDLYLA